MGGPAEVARCRSKTSRGVEALRGLRTLRNRIAHHEPVFARHLAADYRSLFIVTGWISPRTRDWIDHHSRVDQLLELPRDAGGVWF